jgi:N6-L-threonylcarbamoyladenine synthase
LKSAVLRASQAGIHDDADIAAAFQQAAIDCLIDRLKQAMDGLGEDLTRADALVVAGGVAANKAIAARLKLWLPGVACASSRRRLRCAPTMPP